MTGEDGVLGNLPRKRPGVASPRRDASRKAAAQAPRSEPSASERPATDRKEPAGQGEQASGFEELARAGAGLAAVTVAAGAQLTGRVLSEMTKAVGRR
jgi:hypothetical protein